jgi:hypothetical protein
VVNNNTNNIQQKETVIDETQNVFCVGRNCADGFFSDKMLIEKYRECNLQTQMAFIEFRKVFSKVDSNLF